MTQNLENDLLNWVAQEVCDKLFAVAEVDHKIMVNDWCAFAVLAIYREAATILDTISIPSIDDCMAGLFEPQILASNPKWEQLKAWHSEHWLLSQFDCIECQYDDYIAMTELRLSNFMLEL